MTALALWMTTYNVRDHQLAAQVGVSRVQILRIRRGDRKPSPKLAVRIEAQTGIPAWDLIKPEPQRAVA